MCTLDVSKEAHACAHNYSTSTYMSTSLTEVQLTLTSPAVCKHKN